jgi:putative spermidine/putrescine transport system permease protein
MLAPLVVVILTSFTPTMFYQIPTLHWSLRWYRAIFISTGYVKGFFLSCELAVFGAAISLVIGFLTSFVIVRYDFKGKNVVDSLFMLPIAVPSVVLGLALLQFFVRFNLMDTFFSLLIAHVVVTVPYLIRTASASLRAVSRDMELAAMNLGGTWWQSFWYVTMPMVKSGLISGYIFAFLVSFGEVAMTLFIVGSNYQTLPVRMFNFMTDINTPVIAAISALLIFISVAMMLILDRFFGLKNVMS